MNKVYDKLSRCYECFRNKVDFKPEIALVLGSGLGDFADGIEVVCELDYHEIEGFPVSTVPGHQGKYIFGYVGDVPVVCKMCIRDSLCTVFFCYIKQLNNIRKNMPDKFIYLAYLLQKQHEMLLL